MHFFVHIPKTAGTSFRTAAERHFGAQRVVYDYGPDSPVTSECVQRFLYHPDAADHSGLFGNWQDQGIALVAGHQPVTRFLQAIGLRNILTFVREPLERSFSEYLHFRRKNRYRGSFQDFFQSMPANHQHRMAAGIPIRALTFVGITERYDDSLRLLNAHFGWRIRKRRVNRAGLLDPGPGSISAAERQAFYRLNGKDVALYQDACWTFEQRLRLFEQGLPFAHAEIEICQGGKVRGWAFWAEQPEQAVVIELQRNGSPVRQVTAERPHRLLERHAAPRSGRVGFAASMEMAPGDEITAIVAATGQPLVQQPVVVAQPID